MLYIPKIDDYLEIYKEEQKIAKSLHIFLTTSNEVEKYVH